MAGAALSVLAKPFRSLAVAADRVPRGTVLLVAAGVACGLIAFFSIALGKDNRLAIFWLDYGSNSEFPYPFTIQNVMHLLFFVGLGELLVRWNRAEREHACLRWNLLPEDEQVVLQAADLPPIRKVLKERFAGADGFLPLMVNRSILQFQASRSVDQTVSVLNSSLDLLTHQVDMRYSMTRYIVWVIPTVGFIGTVVGIAGALGYVDPSSMDLGKVTANLGIAFNTTIIALLMSALLVFVQHIVQTHEENALNRSAEYTLSNLINRLYVES